MGWVFNAFTLGYLIFEVPGGWMGDAWGARRVLTRIVLWWSLFTALTGCVWAFSLGDSESLATLGLLNGGFLLLLLVRFLFGCGEAGAFPNLARVVGNWFPFQERGFAQGAIWTSARLGGAVAPFLTGRLADLLGWRQAFWVLGLVGIAWCVAFFSWFRNSPKEKPECNEAERELITAGPYGVKASHATGHAWPPWRALLLSPSMGALCLAGAGVSFGWYFYATWQFKFLKEVHRMPDQYAEVFAGLPFLTGAAGALIGGSLSDWLIRHVGRRWGRSLIGFFGFGGAAVCVVLAGLVPASQTWLCVVLLSLATFINDMAVPVIWAAGTDVGGRYAGTVGGVMNMVGGFGPMISQPCIPLWREAYGWPITLGILAAAWFVAALAWLFVDASKPIVVEE
jgi:MFS family permease